MGIDVTAKSARMSGQTGKSGASTEPLLLYAEGTYHMSDVRVFSFFGDFFVCVVVVSGKAG